MEVDVPPAATAEEPEADEVVLGKLGWDLGKQLGTGHFAKVKEATRRSDGLVCAVKIIKKPKELHKRALVAQEHSMLQRCHHPYIVKCHEAFETDTKLYLFMELCTGGELFDRIVALGHFSEAMAQNVTMKLLGALKFMHDQGIAHRDLKPENMLMATEAPDAEVKITDFGLAKFFDEHTALMRTPCGTPGYIAPEVLHMQGYDLQCDIWSLGVIIYILLCGFPPFYADNDALLFQKIKKGDYKFLEPYWDPISDDAKDFVASMLIVDPKQRATASQLIQHKWLASQNSSLSPKNLTTVTELQKSQAALKKLKGVFLAAKFTCRLEHAEAHS